MTDVAISQLPGGARLNAVLLRKDCRTPWTGFAARPSQVSPRTRFARRRPGGVSSGNTPRFVRIAHDHVPAKGSGRIAGLLCDRPPSIRGKETAVAGLLREAPVELDKHLSMHPALRTSDVTGGVFRSDDPSCLGTQVECGPEQTLTSERKAVPLFSVGNRALPGVAPRVSCVSQHRPFVRWILPAGFGPEALCLRDDSPKLGNDPLI